MLIERKRKKKHDWSYRKHFRDHKISLNVFFPFSLDLLSLENIEEGRRGKQETVAGASQLPSSCLASCILYG